ncbi:MAG: hypothetical protein MUF15_12555 [Acidobacteria bacterium]|nr:hypothetical protein [Acidobacteriota bacterium]
MKKDIRYSFNTTEAGTHELVYGLYKDDQLVVSGRLAFDVGNGALNRYHHRSIRIHRRQRKRHHWHRLFKFNKSFWRCRNLFSKRF